MEQNERATISTQEAAEQLNKRRLMVQVACKLYRTRIETARASGGDIDMTPLPNELACQYSGEGRHTNYRVYVDTLPLYQAEPVAPEGRGWHKGRARQKRTVNAIDDHS